MQLRALQQRTARREGDLELSSQAAGTAIEHTPFRRGFGDGELPRWCVGRIVRAGS